MSNNSNDSSPTDLFASNMPMLTEGISVSNNTNGSPTDLFGSNMPMLTYNRGNLHVK